MNTAALAFQDHDYGITTIDAAYVRPGLAAIHLLRENNHAMLIDTGTSYSVPGILDVLKTKNLSPQQVEYIVVTHVHLDHAGGAGALMQVCPQAKLIVHPRGAQHMIDPARLIIGTQAVYGEKKFQRLYGDIPKIPEARVIQADDTYELDFHGRELLFLDTPGHALHHFCIFDHSSQSLFTGDTFGLSYRGFDQNTNNKQGAFVFPATTPIQFDPGALHASINRLLSYPAKKAYLTHYGEVTELPRLAENLHQLIDEFVRITGEIALAHAQDKQQRHTLLVQALSDCLITRLQAHDCQQSKQQIQNQLAMDIELNAQGLENWWDKTQAMHH
ncbi:MBL fold metallo-hydrolase [Candidatus Venteria ishoeyi]|uniref:Hydroxyacylglutathione hydrolase n=1 Tax=Candidatus Venteria ishoeyi TaxID=1899563 RepID=A0A1H6FD49_9GAMM|nr:MBL fold metallo-hydrolase [Candidatus Venteria ishoeyi]SEH07321.1 hydroxyacylglutathione hydrolase [Candidatus Venteria ishoeyi]